MESLSLLEARKLALVSQGLSKKNQQDSKRLKTLKVFERLGYVQIDTISVVQRAHHHTLWSRNASYQVEHLEQLVSNKKIFEYWAHAAAYLPMRDYRFTLPRKHAIKIGEQKHWYQKDHKLMDHVLKRIEKEGPLMAKDFISENNKSNGWGSKPSKQALESLFIQGDLMIPERRKFHKLYDLTERVLPTDLDISMPTEQEYRQFLVLNYFKAHGFGNLTEITYLLKGVKSQVQLALQELCENGNIQNVTIAGVEYFVCSEALALLNQRLNRKQAKILSPFDNLLIQRKRTSHIFNFKYQLECYVPAKKRQFGYFCLPILWDGTLVARADCKVDRVTSTLNVIHLFVEPALRNKELFYCALEEELNAFAIFNQCNKHVINKVSCC